MKNMYELKVLVNFNEVSFHTFSVGNELEALNNLIGSLERSGVKIVASDDVLLESIVLTLLAIRKKERKETITMDKKIVMQRRNNNNKVTYRVFVLIKYEDKLEDFYKEEALASYPDVRALEDMINRVKEHAIDAKKRGLGLEFHISEEYGQAFRDFKFSKNYSADELSLLDLEKEFDVGSYVYMHDIINPIGRSRGIYYFTYSGSLEGAEEYIERSGMDSDLTITISYNCDALRGMEFAIDSFAYTFKDSNVVDLSKSEESREKAPEGPSDALEDFGTKEDLETLLEVMRGLRDDVNGELNDSCVAGVRLVSVRAVDAPGAANYFRRARKDIDERTGLVRLSEIETNELFDKEIGVVVPYLSLRAYLKTGEKGLFARQMEKAQREVMKDFEK